MTKYKIIKDCDGNLLYKKEIETDEHFRDLRRRQTDGQHNRDESLVGDWEYSFYLPRHISVSYTHLTLPTIYSV